MKAIAAEDLTKQYWFFEKEPGFAGSVKALFSGKKVFVDAVRGIRMDIDVGETVGFIGPNGAGKTTTLKMLVRDPAPHGRPGGGRGPRAVAQGEGIS